MLQLINPNSYILAAVFVLAIAFAIIIARFRHKPIAWIAFSALVVALITIHLLLRVSVSEIETPAQFDQVLTSGKPVVLEIYSNY